MNSEQMFVYQLKALGIPLHNPATRRMSDLEYLDFMLDCFPKKLNFSIRADDYKKKYSVVFTFMEDNNANYKLAFSQEQIRAMQTAQNISPKAETLLAMTEYFGNMEIKIKQEKISNLEKNLK